MSRRPPFPLVAVLALVGFLLVVTGTATTVVQHREAPRKHALIEQILTERRDVGDLDQAVAQLRGEVAAAQERSGAISNAQDERNRYEQSLAMAAGTVAAHGPGIVVKVSDAAQQPGAEPGKFTASRIQDGDVQLLVNALFATGAEAVAVNDNRIVAVTSIRAAGGTIQVNYRPMSSPYRIVAIGADKKRFNASDVAAHFREWEKKFDLGFSVDQHDDLTVPAYSGRVGIDLATVQGGEQPTTGATTTTLQAVSP